MNGSNPRGPSDQRWRAVVAALVNDDLRRAYARIVLGEAVHDDRQVTRLSNAGLIEVRDGQVRPATEGLRSVLAESAAPQRSTGQERYLRADGSVDRYPSSASDREGLLRHIGASVMKRGDVLSESELNERLRRFDEDTALLRRSLIDFAILERDADGSAYRLAEAPD